MKADGGIGSVDPSRIESWLEIRPDNTIAIRTGVMDFGQGSVGTSFRQVVAEELRMDFESVSEVVGGDTDRTPDGGVAATVLNKDSHTWMHGTVGLHPGSPFGKNALNLQKVAAFAYLALLERAARVLGQPVESLTAADGVIRSESGSVTYAEIVRDGPLEVTLEVAGDRDGFGLAVLGDPPLVPRAEYRVIGSSSPNPRVPQVVTSTIQWVGDVQLPGMLHGRVVHPRTLGSTLVSVGSLDANRFPGAEVIVRDNLVGVVSPDEWEAVQAAEALAATTEWSDWHGLPGHENLIERLLETDWTQVPVSASTEDRESARKAIAGAPRQVESIFALPFYKHVPMSPDIAVADVRDDGTTHLWTASQKYRALRVRLATMLEADLDDVVVHAAAGSGGFGRTIRGDGGAEAEAAVLSQACGRPVRLQWSREDDFAWSGQHGCYLAEASVGLDESGRMSAFVIEHYNPGINEERLLGAMLAGLPAGSNPPPEALYNNRIWNEWPYDRVPHCLELAYGAPGLGQEESPIQIGLRHRSMRSPHQFQQNFGMECMVSEAAATAGADPIQFRLDHTTDPRLIAVLEAVREMSGWETRPSPAPGARAKGGGVVRGRGLGVAIRHGAYLASVAEIAVELDTGEVTVERYWLATELGVVVNPRLLMLNLEGGSVMGISQALHEEVQFDRGAITNTDYRSYPILTMDEMPEMHIKILESDVFSVGPGAEPPNMVPPIAMTGAFFDATGCHMRRLPMRPEYVRAELREA